MLRVTLRHYYDFGEDRAVVGDDLVRPEAWDDLRTKTSGAFAIPSTRDEFVRLASGRADIEGRARAIHEWLEERNAQTVASYGVGGAFLEWWLHTLRPSRRLIMSDYGEATVERLSEVFPEAEIHRHDLRSEGPADADVHLFHRIDTELDNREWRGVFARFAAVSILLVATEVLDVRRLLLEVRIRPQVRRSHASRAGYLRSRAAFEALWNRSHISRATRMHDLHAWWLTPRASLSAQPDS